MAERWKIVADPIYIICNLCEHKGKINYKVKIWENVAIMSRMYESAIMG